MFSKILGLGKKVKAVDTSRAVWVTYTNWEGKTELRQIVPQRVDFDSNKWHPEPQWLLTAWDVKKNAIRTFALSQCNFRTVENG